MRPLPDVPSDPAVEPRLELVPEVEDAEETESDEVEETEEAEDREDEADTPVVAKAEATQDPLKLYVRAIGDGPLLTPAEERELARRKDEGDEEAKKKLIESNLRLGARNPKPAEELVVVADDPVVHADDVAVPDRMVVGGQARMSLGVVADVHEQLRCIGRDVNTLEERGRAGALLVHADNEP